MFFKKNLKFICQQKVEKTTLKNCSEILNFVSPWAAKMAPKDEFIFQNVAYRPTVYKTGEKVLLHQHTRGYMNSELIIFISRIGEFVLDEFRAISV